MTANSVQGPYPVVFENSTATEAINFLGGHSLEKTGGSDLTISNIGTGSINLRAGGSERVRIASSGNVGIGATLPNYRLHVVGSGGSTVGHFSDGAQSCSITPSVAGNISCSSDKRLKKDIQVVSNAYSLNKILKLETVTYQWNSVSNGRHTGYIAQDVEKIAPEFVTTGKDGFKQVSYTGFTPWITGAIRELYTKVVGHDEELEALKAENAMMKSYLCQKDPKAPFCGN